MTPSLEIYRNLPVLEVAAGECVIEQGANTGNLYVLIEGNVDIVKDGKTVANSKQPGDLFGDLSALLDIPHTTSVRAISDSKFYVATNAKAYLDQNPRVCRYLCELLGRRLVSVTEYLVTVRDQFADHDHIGMVDEVLDKLIHRHPRKRIASRRSTVDDAEIAD